MTARTRTAAEWAREAAKAHTNLTVFHAVRILLEGGTLHGHHPEVAQINSIVNRAGARLLREYDRAMAKVARPQPEERGE